MWQKRLKLFAVLLTCMICLVGCVKVDINISVKKNGSADISMLYAVQESLASMSGDGFGMSDEELAEKKSSGWEVQDYRADGYIGYIMSRENVPLTALDSGEISVQKNGSIYTMDMQFISEEEQSDFNENASMIVSTGGSFKIKMSFPEKPINHNATFVSDDGKTLEWDLLTMNVAEPAHVEFKLSNNLGLIIAVFIVLVLIGGFLLFRMRKKNASDTPALDVADGSAADSMVNVEMDNVQNDSSEA